MNNPTPKNIIICCDGTNNEFGEANTNVVRLFQCLRREPEAPQVGFYDPGVGTLAAPQFTTDLGKLYSQFEGLAFGGGILDNVEDVFRFLMVHYRPGDRVFIFGFSRGAYTAKMVAGMLRKCGLPTVGNESLLPYVRRLYKMRKESDVKKGADVSPEFKETFGTVCPVHFLGLWDTVSAVGIAWNPDVFPYTFTNDEVTIVRHAIAVDERRGFFRTNRWGGALPLKHSPETKQDIVQIWFPGVHSDIGGGYTDGELWKHSFEWMMGEAKAAGMHVDDAKIAGKLGSNRQDWHRSKQHDSLTLGWKLLSIFPKQHRVQEKDGKWVTQFRPALPKWREVRPGERLHRSVIERWRDVPGYRPVKLDPAIMERLKGELQPDTVSLPYA